METVKPPLPDRAALFTKPCFQLLEALDLRADPRFEEFNLTVVEVLRVEFYGVGLSGDPEKPTLYVLLVTDLPPCQKSKSREALALLSSVRSNHGTTTPQALSPKPLFGTALIPDKGEVTVCSGDQRLYIDPLLPEGFDVVFVPHGYVTCTIQEPLSPGQSLSQVASRIRLRAVSDNARHCFLLRPGPFHTLAEASANGSFFAR